MLEQLVVNLNLHLYVCLSEQQSLENNINLAKQSKVVVGKCRKVTVLELILETKTILLKYRIYNSNNVILVNNRGGLKCRRYPLLMPDPVLSLYM